MKSLNNDKRNWEVKYQIIYIMFLIYCGFFAILLTCIVVPPVWYVLLTVLRLLVRSDLLFHTLNLIWEAVCITARIIGYLFNLTYDIIPSVCSNIIKFTGSIHRIGSFLLNNYGIVGLTVGIFMVILCIINLLDMFFGLRNPADFIIQQEHENHHDNNNQGQRQFGNAPRLKRRFHIQQDGEHAENVVMLRNEYEPAGLQIKEKERVQHDGAGQCGVCFERARDTALFPCGHTQVCAVCVAVIRESTNKCPICLSAIRDHKQIYL